MNRELRDSDINSNLDSVNVDGIVTHEDAICTLRYCILAA